MEFFPKFADIKFLKEMSKVLVTPMLIAAYLIQTDFSIFGIKVDSQSSFAWQLVVFAFIFIVSSSMIGILVWILNDVLIFTHIYSNSIALPIVASLFIALGFLGVFSGELPFSVKLNPMWFYTAFVVGFYMLAKASDIDNYE